MEFYFSGKISHIDQSLLSVCSKITCLPVIDKFSENYSSTRAEWEIDTVNILTLLGEFVWGVENI